MAAIAVPLISRDTCGRAARIVRAYATPSTPASTLSAATWIVAGERAATLPLLE